MGKNNISFSLSEDSVNEINGLIEEFACDIVGIINGFQDELIEHISSANYDKLLRAVDGIIELYNDSVCTDLRKSIFDKWQDACESMSSFAEKMEMGEESEIVTFEIEETLSNIFDTSIDNRIRGVHTAGKTSASISDFNNVNEMFLSVINKIKDLSDNLLRETERLGDENEFYKFLTPVVVAYSEGICNYFGNASSKIDELTENYVTKMAEKRDLVEQSNKEVDLSSLLDFSDLAYAGMGILKIEAAPTTVENENSNTQYNNQVESHEKRYKELIDALEDFNVSTCCYRNLKQQIDKHMSQYHKNLDDRLKQEYDKMSQDLKKYYEQIANQLNISYKNLNARYINRTITIQQAQNMYAESSKRANQLLDQKKFEFNQAYNYIKQQAVWKYNTENNRCAEIAKDILERRVSTCKKIFEQRNRICKTLNAQGTHEEVINELKQLIENAQKLCDHSCMQISNIGRLIEISLQVVSSSNVNSLFEEDNGEKFISELYKCQALVDQYVNDNLDNLLKDEKKDLKMDSTVVFQSFNDFADNLSVKNKNPREINGYYSPIKKMSFVKIDGPHPSKTAIHEHVHALSDPCMQEKQADGMIIAKSGVKVTTYSKNPQYLEGKDDPQKKYIRNVKYLQLNEALTEFFCKKIMGNDYPPKTHVLYTNNMKELERMECGFGIDILREAYFLNKPELLKNRFDDIMGNGEWDKFAKAMDDSIDPSKQDDERKKALSYVDYFSRAFSIKTRQEQNK